MDNNIQTEDEKLKQTIKDILIKVYNKKLLEENKDTENIKKKIEQFQNDTKDITFEKHLKILKILIDNIYEIMNIFKEKILNLDVIKEIKKKYDKEIKNYNNINNNKNINIENNNKNFNKFTINYFPNVSIEKITAENSLEKIKDGLERFLYDLEAIKLTLDESSPTLKNIFQNSLNILQEQDGKQKTFDFTLIHKQVFNDILLDNFIQLVLIKLKNEFKNEFGNKINNIQENPLTKLDEMTKFKDFVYNEINIVNNIKNESDILDTKLQKNLDHIKHIKNEKDKDKDYIMTPVVPKKINTTNNNNNSINNNDNKDDNKVNNNKEIKYQTLDQLLNFINNNNNEENKVEKGKKKKNKKRKKNNDNNNNEEKDKNNENNIKEDKFIEDIKKSMKEESCNKKKIRKIKPKISKDWLATNI